MTKLDRIVKTAGLGNFIKEHKDAPWFYPTAGGVAGGLLATPEIIEDAKADKSGHALRRLILSTGFGAGVGYVGGKALKGEVSDLKKKVVQLKNLNESGIEIPI